MKVLAAWLGNTDLGMARSGESAPVGPIAQALAADKYDLLLLLVNQPKKDCKEYVSWLKGVAPIDVELFPAKLSSPTDFSSIYRNALEALKQLTKKGREKAKLTFHLSPGTPAMGAVWIILGSTQYPATLIQSSIQQGVKNANVPFDIAAEFNPGLLKSADQKQQDLNSGKARSSSTFGDIIYRSEEMDRVVTLAKRVASKNLTVLIEGESGTGKELFAHAIHNNSPRSARPPVVINCGAIPPSLIEAELFGHTKTAFTGASDRKGAFEEAHCGTLFLDEIGELPLNDQVKLLRVLQEGEIKRIGENTTRSVDVRVIAATNKSLSTEVAEGRFREDLYYRLNVWPLTLPPLRDRKGDLGPLLEKFLDQINQESIGDPGYTAKVFSPASKNILLTHSWPGNVRELQSIIRRATLFSDQPKISKENMQDAIQPSVNNLAGNDPTLNRDLSDGFDLEGLVDEVKINYLKKAVKLSHGNIGEASEILGYKNYQTLQYALEKYNIEF